ncbi:MAG: hypothetical protein WBQ86_11080, partial [Candidatus Binatus sp.]
MRTAPIAGNDLVVSFAEYQTPGDVSAVDMVGGTTTACSLALGPIDGDSNFSFYQYYCNNVPSGTTGIRFTQGARADTEIVNVEQLSGAGTLSVDKTANALSGSSSLLSTGTTLTLATTGEWAVAGCELAAANMSSTSITAGPTNSYIGSVGILSSTTVTNMGLVAAYNSVVGTTGTSTTWSWSTTDAHDCGVVAYECSSGPPATPIATATTTATAAAATVTATLSPTPTATRTSTGSATATASGGPTATATATAVPTATSTGGASAAVVSAIAAMTSSGRIGVNMDTQ